MTNSAFRPKPALAPLACLLGLLSAALAVWTLGPEIVDPRQTGWMRDDFVTMQFGWEAYRADPASAFKLATARVSWPLPLNIAFFDLVPLVALPLKLLSPWLPAHVQYFGPLFVANVFLQGFFAVLCLGEGLRQRPPSRTLLAALFCAAALIAAAPMLYVRFRLGHPPLTAHWTLLAALWLAFRAERVGVAATIGGFVLLLALLGGLNPYLLVMAALIYLAALGLAFARGALDRRGWLLAPAPLLVAFAALVGFGFVRLGGGGVVPGEGYGYYNANLNTLFNPMANQFGASLLPALGNASPYQYEGYAYLGAGGLFLLAFAFAYGLHEAERRRYGPILLAALAGLILAIGFFPTFGDGFNAQIPLPQRLFDLLATFRSSGRFIWVTAYALWALAGVVLLQKAPPRLALAVCAAALALQVADLAAPFARVHRYFARQSAMRFTDPAFADLGAGHDLLIVSPPWQCSGDADYPRETFQPLSWLAMDNGLPTNSFYAGRLPLAQKAWHCEEFPKILATETPQARTAYLFTPKAFVAGAASNHFCDLAEGFIVCRGDRGRAGLSDRARAALTP